MVFAEQRLLAMLARKHGMKAGTFSSMDALLNGKQDSFTHLWGHKQVLKDNAEEAVVFCHRCAVRIRADYHEAFAHLSQLDWFRKYCLYMGSMGNLKSFGEFNQIDDRFIHS